MRMPKKALLLLAAGAAIVAMAASSGAAPEPKQPKTNAQANVDAVLSGKAKKVATKPERAESSVGVWHGCRFFYPKTKVSTYETADGTLVEVVSDPEPLPPKDKDCVERNPTQAEIIAMRAQLDTLNAKARTPGAPAPPPLPPPRS